MQEAAAPRHRTDGELRFPGPDLRLSGPRIPTFTSLRGSSTDCRYGVMPAAIRSMRWPRILALAITDETRPRQDRPAGCSYNEQQT